MPERQWYADEEYRPGLELDGDYEVVEAEDELADVFQEAHSVLKRIGGVIMIAAMREEVADDLFVTTGYAVKWESYAPGKRQQKSSAERKPKRPPRQEPQIEEPVLQGSAVDNGAEPDEDPEES